MAKTQKAIVKCINDGICKNFERFATDNISRIIGMYKHTFQSNSPFNNLFFKDYKEADRIVILSTPNGYEDSESVILADFLAEEFFEKISA